MDCERPKGKTVTIVGATGRMDAHYPWLRTSAVAARLVLTKRRDNVAGIGKPLEPAGGARRVSTSASSSQLGKPRLLAAEWRQNTRRPNP
jgi:hypothetical protein